MTRDDQGRPADGPEWLTLTEAAIRSGYSRDALRQRVRRGSLRSAKGNDGQLRIQVRDLADLPPLDVTGDVQGRPGDATVDAALDVLRTNLDDLRTDLERTRTALDVALVDRLNDHGRAERAEAETAAAVARVAVAEAVTAEAQRLLEQRAAELAVERARAGEAAIRTATAEAEVRGLREALVEARRPFWRRLLGS